jgi:signal peptidase II
MPRPFARLLLALVLVLTVGCDHATKHAAARSLSAGKVIELVPSVLDLRYVENHDVAFSVLGRLGISDARGLITGLAVATLGLIAVVWFRQRKSASPLEHLGFATALGGGLGNVVDRLARGFVVDFIHLHHWPVFNVADVAIAVGVGLILLGTWRRSIRGDLDLNAARGER